MSNIDPSIINLLRGKGNVGSDSLNHVHHLPRRMDTIDNTSDIDATGPEEQLAPPDDKRPFFGQLMRSALQGIRRQQDGSVET